MHPIQVLSSPAAKPVLEGEVATPRREVSEPEVAAEFTQILQVVNWATPLVEIAQHRHLLDKAGRARLSRGMSP